MDSVEATDGALYHNCCDDPCWEHDECRLSVEPADTRTALRGPLDEHRTSCAGKSIDAWLA